LQHVLMNLISNAVKFTKRDRVSLKVGWHSDEMMFKIEDTGAGNPDDLRHRIFNDFVTGNAVYDREVNGTGLGLSIAKRFIHLLGGEIAVASELGVGSTFRVVVPAKIAISPVKSLRQIEGPSVVTPLRVLVVEDNEIN
jgi:signal transduction histidine kinase